MGGIERILEVSLTNPPAASSRRSSAPPLRDFPCPDDVVCTIAMSICPRGEFLASTHGDHTVKIFRLLAPPGASSSGSGGSEVGSDNYGPSSLHRVLVGHPRTPWTVKFHPSDANLVASGCLGMQVRVWDVARGVTLHIAHFPKSVHSLSFHPQGVYLAVAAGMSITLWRFREGSAGGSRSLASAAAATSSAGGGDDSSAPVLVQVSHSKNVRGVLFSPSGESLFVCANDSSSVLARPGDAAPCRLFVIPTHALIVSPAGPVATPLSRPLLPPAPASPAAQHQLQQQQDAVGGGPPVMPLSGCSLVSAHIEVSVWCVFGVLHVCWVWCVSIYLSI